MVALWCTRGLLRQASLYFLFSHGGVSHIVVSIHCHHLMVSHRHDTTSSYVDTSSQGEEVLPYQSDIIHNSIGGSKIYFHDKIIKLYNFCNEIRQNQLFLESYCGYRQVFRIGEKKEWNGERMEGWNGGRMEMLREVMRRQAARGLHAFLPDLYNSGGRGLLPSCARCLSAGKVNGKRLVKHVKPPCTEAKLLSVRMTMMIGRNVIQPLLDEIGRAHV